MKKFKFFDFFCKRMNNFVKLTPSLSFSLPYIVISHTQSYKVKQSHTKSYNAKCQSVCLSVCLFVNFALIEMLTHLKTMKEPWEMLVLSGKVRRIFESTVRRILKSTSFTFCTTLV